MQQHECVRSYRQGCDRMMMNLRPNPSIDTICHGMPCHMIHHSTSRHTSRHLPRVHQRSYLYRCLSMSIAQIDSSGVLLSGEHARLARSTQHVLERVVEGELERVGRDHTHDVGAVASVEAAQAFLAVHQRQALLSRISSCSSKRINTSRQTRVQLPHDRRVRACGIEWYRLGPVEACRPCSWYSTFRRSSGATAVLVTAPAPAPANTCFKRSLICSSISTRDQSVICEDGRMRARSEGRPDTTQRESDRMRRCCCGCGAAKRREARSRDDASLASYSGYDHRRYTCNSMMGLLFL